MRAVAPQLNAVAVQHCVKHFKKQRLDGIRQREMAVGLQVLAKACRNCPANCLLAVAQM